MRDQNETRKRRGAFFRALLSLAFLLFGLCLTSKPAMAEDMAVRNVQKEQDYSSLETALAEVDKGEELKLTDDIKLQDCLVVTADKEFTLNLNGYAIDLNEKFIRNSGKLSVINKPDSQTKRTYYFSVSNSGSSLSFDLIENPTEAQMETAADPSEKINSFLPCYKVEGGLIYNGIASGQGENSRGGAFENLLMPQSSAKSDLSIDNVIFVDCRAYYGGAISNEGGNLTLTNVKAYGCTAVYGGVVFNVANSTMNIKDCIFNYDIVQGAGGALFNLGNATVSGLQSFLPVSYTNGAAICNGIMDSPNSEMTLKDSLIEGAVAQNYGGAIINHGILAVSGTTIKGAQAGIGGAIYNYNKLDLTDSVIRDCQAQAFGGAIFNDGIGMHHKEPAKATDTITTLDRVRIENCKSFLHKANGSGENDPGWDESVYVRNSSFVIKDSYIENPIFLRSNPDFTDGEVQETGYPACNIQIISGTFKNMNLDVVSQDGAALVTNKNMGPMYVFEKTFKAALDPADGSAGWDEKVSATLKADADADTYKIVSYDKASDTWEVLADEIKANGGTGSFTFTTTEKAEKTICYRAFAIKKGVPYALSDEFTITWKKPAEKKDNKDDKKDTPVPAAKGTKLDVKTENGEIYTVTSSDASSPEVSFSLPASVKVKSIKVGGTVVYNGVTYKITSIADNAFKNNKSVKTIEISETVTSIGKNAFNGCKSLTTIIFPASVTKFGPKLFAKCPKLKLIKFKSKALKDKYFHKQTFKGLRTACVIKVYKKKVKAYKAMFRKKGLSKKGKVKKM